MKNRTRRQFIAATAAGLSLPLFNIGCAGFGADRPRQLAQGAKIRLALIGCGGRMGTVKNRIYGIVHTPLRLGEEIVAMVDPDPRMIVKMKGVIKYWQPNCDVERIPVFADYREFFAQGGCGADAVMISTPNHHHCLAALMAMKLGMHVYVEKPMALTIEEVRLMHAAAKTAGVATQVGNHGHSEEGMRRLVEFIAAGAIGQVREVYSYDDRLNSMRYRPPAAPPPAGMDWDSWCGPAPVCDYYAGTEDHNGLHPHDWHSWIGYGNGSIGNMGTHIIDPVFWALQLGGVSPMSVVATDLEQGCPGSWTWRNTVHWKFPARGQFDAVTLHWYDGVKDGIPYDKAHVDKIGCCRKREYQNLPPIVEEVERKYGVELGCLGSLFVGEKGFIRIGPHGDALVFAPKELYRAKPPKTITREKGMDHQVDWLRAIRNPDRPAGCNFDYSAPLAETVLLGNVVARVGKNRELKWDGEKVTNMAEANQFLRTEYRSGWVPNKV